MKMVNLFENLNLWEGEYEDFPEGRGAVISKNSSWTQVSDAVVDVLFCMGVHPEQYYDDDFELCVTAILEHGMYAREPAENTFWFDNLNV